jgi:hypothetical protein
MKTYMQFLLAVSIKLTQYTHTLRVKIIFKKFAEKIEMYTFHLINVSCFL